MDEIFRASCASRLSIDLNWSLRITSFSYIKAGQKKLSRPSCTGSWTGRKRGGDGHSFYEMLIPPVDSIPLYCRRRGAFCGGRYGGIRLQAPKMRGRRNGGAQQLSVKRMQISWRVIAVRDGRLGCPPAPGDDLYPDAAVAR